MRNIVGFGFSDDQRSMIVPRPSFQTRMSFFPAFACIRIGFIRRESARPSDRIARIPANATVSEAVRSAAMASTAIADMMTKKARMFCMVHTFLMQECGSCSFVLQELRAMHYCRSLKRLAQNRD